MLFRSNIILGVEPHLNINIKCISIQPGVSVEYLMQKGASVDAYFETTENPVLNFPAGNVNRNLWLFEPNIRLVLGNSTNLFRFYALAGYNFAIGHNEYSYTFRDYKEDASGNVNIKELLNSSLLEKTEEIIPSYLTRSEEHTSELQSH